MKIESFQFGRWALEWLAGDGARLGSLRFDGADLLTVRPVCFKPPRSDYGHYETRPVYGYDDCFPTVDACRFPGDLPFDVDDHGEICWLPWKVHREVDNCVVCTVSSRQLPVRFTRSMIFGETSLQWKFEVVNEADWTVPFLHVMHGLMPLDQVCDLSLPPYGNLFDEIAGRQLPAVDPADLSDRLLGSPAGSARMLLLRDLEASALHIGWRSGLSLQVEFPIEWFPTLGIWWNHGGYPDEAGCRRVECAFEPIPARSSSLARSYEQGTFLSVGPNDRLEWSVFWKINT